MHSSIIFDTYYFSIKSTDDKKLSLSLDVLVFTDEANDESN